MLKEAIDRVVGLARDSQTPNAFSIEGKRHATYVAIGTDLTEHTHEIPPRRHCCLDLESLGRFTSEPTGSVVVWYGFDCVEAVLNDEGYRDSRVRMPLTVHPKFKAALAGSGSVSQSGLIQWIRQNLRQEFTEASPGFEPLVRKLKFSKGSGGEGSVQHGQESFSQEVLAEVTGASDIPEEVTLHVPVWEEFSLTVPLTLGVYIDAHDGLFALLPLTGETARARQTALDVLQELVESECKDAEIYRGTP